VFEPLASRKGLQIVLDIEGVPARVLGDVVRFRQVLRNLVSNAIKFTAKGEVRIRLRHNGTHLLGEVRDTGIGIDPERLPALFTPFTQADRSTTRRFGGTGLGLSIARRLCEAMGGSLNASSQPGRGTTFSFELTAPVTRYAFDAPLAGTRVEVVDDRHTSMVLATLGCELVDRRGDADIVLAHTAVFTTAPLVRIGTEPIEGERARLGAPVRRIAALHVLLRVIGRSDVSIHAPAMLDESAPRILVAEDNPVNQRIVRKAIELAGRRCDVVDDGEAAVRAAHSGRYDLIFMDCQMPRIDGYDATRAIRSLSMLRQPRIVALTAYAHESDRERCAEAGMDEYASKPVSIDLIGQIVRRVFG
jgi:hypothetical protein